MGKKRKNTGNRHGLQVVTLCISTALVLILLGLVLFTASTAQNLSSYMKENLVVTVMLRSDMSGAEGRQFCKAIKAKPYKTAVAVSTVVIFGTLAMFVYPVLYRNGVFDLNPQQMGIYTGSTVHEVAHVVGAGNAMGPEVSNSAIIVKMIRVMMLVPVLLVISFFMMRAAMKSGEGSSRGKINMPWFAILFLVVIAFNSFDLLPAGLVDFINTFDTFLLTMAMTALGAETSIDKFRKAGFKPFVLAFILFIWLMGGGYCLAKYVVPMLG